MNTRHEEVRCCGGDAINRQCDGHGEVTIAGDNGKGLDLDVTVHTRLPPFDLAEFRRRKALR